jgi:hypothetical protein
MIHFVNVLIVYWIVDSMSLSFWYPKPEFSSIKDSLGQAQVSHACNPSYSGGRDWDAQSQPGQIVLKTPS